jgi:hypothetical protein
MFQISQLFFLGVLGADDHKIDFGLGVPLQQYEGQRVAQRRQKNAKEHYPSSEKK